MRLDRSTWKDIDAYLTASDGIILPTGSTEQHGPIGLIGTDAICAEAIAEGAATIAGALVAPTLAYTPAPFNMGFAGTVSIAPETFSQLAGEILDGLARHGFRHIYILNGHGANLDPLRAAIAMPRDCSGGMQVRLKSWWDFGPVNALRKSLYGDWEGMHATPSEIAIVQSLHGVVDHPPLAEPERLTADYIKAHAGDRHGTPVEHRNRFPDGRVGSHSSLARPEHGEALLATACAAVAKDYRGFVMSEPERGDAPMM